MLVAATVARFGAVDVLVHSAANVPLVNDHDARLTEIDPEVWTRIIDLFLNGTFHVCRFVGRQMLAQGGSQAIPVAGIEQSGHGRLSDLRHGFYIAMYGGGQCTPGPPAAPELMHR